MMQPLFLRLFCLLFAALPLLASADTDTNKTQVLALYAMLNAGDYDNLGDVVAPDYRTEVPDHEGMPALPQGLDGLSASLAERGAIANDVKRVVSDGELVFVQVKYPGDKVIAGVDIFRLDDAGKIVHHWPRRQAVTDDVADPDTLYAGGGDASTPMTEEQLQRNRTIIREAFEKVWREGRAELTLDYYATGYKQHNPHIADGGERIRQIIETHVKPYIEETGNLYPVEIVHIGAQGDLVFIHCNIVMLGLGRNEGVKTTSVDIMRIDDEGKLAEHWDVLQMETDSLPNFDTLF
ncbi:MAG: nuclear transport factor 2 family protein [Porticoccaceae bacterium]